MKKLQVGDLVKYTAAYLKNTGQFATGIGHDHGVVSEVIDAKFVRIKWDSYSQSDYERHERDNGKEYADTVKAKGMRCNVGNIAVTGSAGDHGDFNALVHNDYDRNIGAFIETKTPTLPRTKKKSTYYGSK